MKFSYRISIKTVMFILFLFILSGCSSDHAKYPTTWPAIHEPPSPNCAILSGMYINEASDWSKIDYNNHKSGALLTSWFWEFDSSNHAERNDYKFVSFLLSTNTEELVLEYLDKSEKVSKTIKLRTPEDYYCSDNSIEIRGWHSGLSEAGANMVSSITSIYKTINGSLVVKYKFSRTGLFSLFIPNRAVESEWHIYNQKTPSSK